MKDNDSKLLEEAYNKIYEADTEGEGALINGIRIEGERLGLNPKVIQQIIDVALSGDMETLMPLLQKYNLIESVQINGDAILIEGLSETFGVTNARNLLKFKNKNITADMFLRNLIIGDLHPEPLQKFVANAVALWKERRADVNTTAINIYHKLTKGY